MAAVSANELKIKGISALEAILGNRDEAIISVRGKPRYVVMDLAHYEQLREAEIHAAWQEARAAKAQGDYHSETAETHIAQLQQELAEHAV
ncbi:MAG: type II toxin-antitoxin system Phd/YefM family antitoxin [Methylococcaceae bacterium]|nr:MAG: type II toxin-antitoxin system Phd/YefM family antitoxin [Methylococcaceae bacterium]